MEDDSTALTSVERVMRAVRQRASAQTPGSKLVSSRVLAAELGVGPVTVQRALDRLVADGFIVTRPGAGTFVAERTPERPTSDLSWQSATLGAPRIDASPVERLVVPLDPSITLLSSGYLGGDLQAVSLLNAATQRALRKPSAWGHTPRGGMSELRDWFADAVGGGHRASDVTIAPGGQAALSTAFRALGVPGQPVVIESPTYPGALVAARAAGLRLVPWPVEPTPDAARLDHLVVSSGATLVFAQSRFANPTGASWSDATRTEVQQVLHQRNAFLIDDDWAADLSLDGDAPPSMAGDDADGHVVVLRSLTKLVAPGMRLAAIAARGPAAQRLAAVRVADDLAVSGLLQRVALELVTSPSWSRHLRVVRHALAHRRDALIELVSDWLGSDAVTRPTGGLHLWVRLSDDLDATSLSDRALRAGVFVSPGREWYPGEALGERLRLSYSAADVPQLAAAMTTLRSLAAVGVK
jgi:DNA-binding transcriptional MocR family regulator